MHVPPIFPHAVPTAGEPGRQTPSVQDARDRLPSLTNVSATRLRALDSSLKKIASMAGLPPGAILLTPPILRERVLGRSAAADQLERESRSTVLSDLRFVLRCFDIIDGRDGPLLPAWEVQLAGFRKLEQTEEDRLARAARLKKVVLFPFGRFCSARNVPPEGVCVETLIAFELHLANRTLAVNPSKTAGAVRGAWNRACAQAPGWIGQPLGLRKPAGQYVLPLKIFPESFQADLALFGQRLGATSLDLLEDPIKGEDDDTPLVQAAALRSSSVALRQSHTNWAASAAVASGVPIVDITSLASLVTPLERAKAAIRYLYDRAGGKPSAAGMHVAEVLCIIAKHYVRLPPKQVAKIKSWGKPVALKYRGMTEKNERSVREIMQPDRLEKLLALPDALMQAARQLRVTSPNQARSLALRAVAIGILLRLPLRLANLAGMRLDRHFHRPDPRRGLVTHVMIPAEDTKNKRPISLPVSKATAKLIEEWIADYRTPSVPGCAYLFPGLNTGDRPIGHQGLREAIKRAVKAHAGVALTPHQFRHLAARLFLEAYPGHFEELRQLLGHETVTSTTRSYSGAEGEAAARRYDEALLSRHNRKKPAPGRRGPGRPGAPRPGRG